MAGVQIIVNIIYLNGKMKDEATAQVIFHELGSDRWGLVGEEGSQLNYFHAN